MSTRCRSFPYASKPREYDRRQRKRQGQSPAIWTYFKSTHSRKESRRDISRRPGRLERVRTSRPPKVGFQIFQCFCENKSYCSFPSAPDQERHHALVPFRSGANQTGTEANEGNEGWAP